MPKKNGDFTAAERRAHIEGEASFKTTVLNEFKFAREQRTEDKRDFKDRFDKMEEKHTDTYKDVFGKIEDNGKDIATNTANIKTNAKKTAGIGGVSGLTGSGIMMALKEFFMPGGN